MVVVEALDTVVDHGLVVLVVVALDLLMVVMEKQVFMELVVVEVSHLVVVKVEHLVLVVLVLLLSHTQHHNKYLKNRNVFYKG